MIKIDDIKKLREHTGCSMMQCKSALEYSKGDLSLSIAYLKALTIAVATPNLTFDERVQFFLRRDYND